MKKLAIMAIGVAAALVLPGSVFAQDGVIQASATVSTVANIDAENALVFGEVAPGDVATVAYNSAASSGTTAGTGYVAFSTNAGYNVTVATPTVLTNAGAADDIAVTFTCGYSNDTGTLATAAFTCADGHSNASVTAMENVVIWLGGQATVPATAAAGEYTADITVQMTNP